MIPHGTGRLVVACSQPTKNGGLEHARETQTEHSSKPSGTTTKQVFFTWDVRKPFRKLVEEVSFGVSQLAFANLAKCRQRKGPSPEPLISSVEGTSR